MKANDSVMPLMFRAVSTYPTGPPRVKQITVGISCTVLCSFSSERPPQQENVQGEAAETKTAENNGGPLCTISAFIITQPAANWEQNRDRSEPEPK